MQVVEECLLYDLTDVHFGLGGFPVKLSNQMRGDASAEAAVPTINSLRSSFFFA